MSSERGLARWWTYQAERFPLAQHGPLVVVFSYSALCFARLLRTGDAPFSLPTALAGTVAFVGCFGFFMQLRIADEHKDFEEDARFRAYRPVPRGLVTLRELTVVGVLVGLIQTGAAIAYEPRLLILLGVTWIYFALMSKEFFVRAWISQRPLLYMLSHMMIMPLIDLYATGCDWMPVGGPPHVSALTLFLVASYGNGMVIELGRKIRAPADEEDGVGTYSARWGRRISVIAWLAALAAAAAAAIAAASAIGYGWWVAAATGAMWIVAAAIGRRFVRDPRPGSGSRIELASGLWIIALYLSLGIGPALHRAFT